MATFSHEGQFIDITPEAAVSAGDFYAIGSVWGVAPYDIAAGALGVVQVKGVFDAVLKSGDTVAVGDALYKYGTAGVSATEGSASGSGSTVPASVGVALAAVTGDGAKTVRFLLNG